MFRKIWNFIKRLFGCCCECSNTNEETKCLNNANLNVEHIISTDRQCMYLNYSNDYRWFETGITLNNFLDGEDTDATVESVYNIFQTVVEHGNGYDTEVICVAHKGTETGTETKAAFWVGDMLLNEAEIKLTFEDAYNRLMEANLPKPHSRQCVLRKELGPKEANAQYIFGNIREHIYVDAVTGDVKTTNPVYEGFEKDKKFSYAFTWLNNKSKEQINSPLGEWP